ncbi:hypothetical protein A3E15_02605 [Candidatus Woesebacteria bacterium RIFCSPHIGHO2_12_FULL_42_9]|uniref:Uncharacterized protein n=2 Tax=Candidatus Woeseibacteriota TaxID=1752722 RepID=A0A1F8AVW2_9BACT|nr:MAG: hypothetical protein A2129_01615 [Candidatus Woesebacteria bacterium GWC1_42_13]OGM55871.1 MAG: hypothetical protein A3E15_02605 [Candidatus Woesebacteria bacterium RIFCSPHIGHO2_12_FULL_42_9]
MEIAQIDFETLYGELNQGRANFVFSESLTLGQIISSLVPYLFVIAGLLLLLYLIFGGFGLLTSRGDPKAVASAKERITFAVVGFVIVFASYWIVQIVGQILGIEAVQDIFG